MSPQLTLMEIRSEMAKSRTACKRTAIPRTKKFTRFCMDKDAFNWACRFYRYTFKAYHGNVECIHEDTFGQMYTIIHDRDNFVHALKELGEDRRASPDDGEIEYLIRSMNTLRKRYM